MAIPWTKECKEFAKKNKRPLVQISIDGRHIPKGEPGYGGKIDLAGHCNAKLAARLYRLATAVLKDTHPSGCYGGGGTDG